MRIQIATAGAILVATALPSLRSRRPFGKMLGLGNERLKLAVTLIMRWVCPRLAYYHRF